MQIPTNLWEFEWVPKSETDRREHPWVGRITENAAAEPAYPLQVSTRRLWTGSKILISSCFAADRLTEKGRQTSSTLNLSESKIKNSSQSRSSLKSDCVECGLFTMKIVNFHILIKYMYLLFIFLINEIA